MNGQKILIIILLFSVLIAQSVCAFSLTVNDQAYMKTPMISISDQYGILDPNVTNNETIIFDPDQVIFISYEPAGIFNLGSYTNNTSTGVIPLVYSGADWIDDHKGQVIAIIIILVVLIYTFARRGS